MILTFPYQRIPGVQSSPAAPDRGIYRPRIPLKISGPAREHVAVALVDTGADEIILPYNLAALLVIKLESRLHYLMGLSGKLVPVQYGMVRLQIGRPDVGQFAWDAKAAFQENRPYPVLGYAGCLDRFSVNFDGPGRILTITTP